MKAIWNLALTIGALGWMHSTSAAPVDPLEPLAMRAAVLGWAGDSLPQRPEGLDLWLGTGNRAREGQAAWRAGLGANWTLDVLVVGSDHPDARQRQGSIRTKGGWSGRLMRGLLAYRSPHLDLELGRGRLGSWQGGVDDPALGLSTTPVDLGRLALKLPAWHLRVETLAAALPTEQAQSGMQRWLGGHELIWEHGPWQAAVGDLVLYTGVDRGLEPAYLNPFLPAFVANFEDVAEADTIAHRDNDNNLLRGRLAWRQRRGDWLGRVGLDLVVDEFQMDQVDRDDMQDVWGLRLAAASSWTRPSGVWQLGGSASRLSSWLYQHPGEETDLSVDGIGLGHPAGGDLLELRLSAAWLPSASFSLWPGFWAEGSGVRLEAGLRRKGAISLADPWDPTSTVDEDLPIDPETRPRWLSIDLRAGWRPRPDWTLQAWLTRTFWADRPAAEPDGGWEAGLRVGWFLAAPGGRP
jgi:hypothetical protein